MSLSNIARWANGDPSRGQWSFPGLWVPSAESTRPSETRRDPDRPMVVSQRRPVGVSVGSALFGWFTAMGVAALLVNLLAGAGIAIGLTATQDAGRVSDTSGAIGMAGGSALAVTLLVAFFCGGYVAARMARSQGRRQGLAVWLCGIVVAVVLAALVAVAGAQYNVLGHLNLPRIPVNEGTLTTGGFTALAVGVLAGLAGALMGGAAGMRHRRRIDAAARGRR